MASAKNGPVVFAYDGSDLANAAIAEAGRQLSPSRQAIVLTFWQPFNVGFVTPHELKMNAAAVNEVRAAVEETAAQGASPAQAAGFEVTSMAREAAPTWKGIVERYRRPVAMCRDRSSKIARRSSCGSVHQASDFRIGISAALVASGRPRRVERAASSSCSGLSTYRSWPTTP